MGSLGTGYWEEKAYEINMAQTTLLPGAVKQSEPIKRLYEAADDLCQT
jgi:hypothetical protein